ncbi:MAG: winged helix-turn-helix transcriptional regulator, partial [archaeon]|nr:winged helix-turn-helix transcriptional regulator [archaeon]
FEGKDVIEIAVPRANRFLRPIYCRILETGTFKRNGKEDYHCTMPEIASMLRDQNPMSYDSTCLEKSSFDDIDIDTLHSFRNEMRVVQPDHMWNKVDDKDFARKIGVIGHSTEELTVAGLLMFGKEEVIYSYFPRFKLDYMECPLKNTSWIYRKVTGDGLWVGNVYNFFSTVRARIGSDVDQPLEIDRDMHRIMDTDTHKAIRECLLNCLIHADYPGNLVVKIEKYPKMIVMTNSGLFRIPLDIAKNGGESDPRNAVIAKMFSLIGMSERAGVGINFIFDTWKKTFGGVPKVSEDVGLQRTSVELDLVHGSRFLSENRSNDESVFIAKGDELDESILLILKTNPKISMERVSEELGVSRPTVSNHISLLKSRGLLERVGGTRGYWKIR